MKICDLLSWADFSTIYSDKVTEKERKKREKNQDSSEGNFKLCLIWHSICGESIYMKKADAPVRNSFDICEYGGNSECPRMYLLHEGYTQWKECSIELYK